MRRTLKAAAVAAYVVSASWAGCKDPLSEVPQAVVTGLILTPIGDPFGGADVVAQLWVDPAACVGEPSREAVTGSRDDGSFSVLVSGRRGVVQEDACLVVRALPLSTSGFVPGSAHGLEATLRVESPLDTVAVVIRLNKPPPP